MHVDVSQETDPGDPILEIPWADPDRPATRHADLKRHPEAVLELEECRRYPALGDFLLQVNSAGSAFRTAKSDVWATREMDLDEKVDFGMPCKVASYVDLLFDRAEVNAQVDSYRQLASSIEHGARDLRMPAQVELQIRRCIFVLENRAGYYVTIYVHAYGPTPQEAERHWNEAMQSLAGILTVVDREAAWRAADTTGTAAS